ncbi:MAG: hypothetical protein LBD07_00795 [Spirochaetaceae bacterium]|nr:hypothetical protein [Spirochaetaceae bacterium]
MKKFFLILIFATVLTKGGFAENRATNTITTSVVCVGFNIKYECSITDNFSALAEYWINGFSGWGAEGHIRYYPWANPVFLDVGLGYGRIYNLLSLFMGGLDKLQRDLQNKEDPDSDAYNNSSINNAFLISPTIGLRLDIGRPNGWIFEPSIGAEIGIGNGPEGRPGVCKNFDLKLAMGYSF